MEIVISVVAKVAECMVRPILRHIVCPIVRPIARPFINLWEYKSNLENLKKEVKELEAKRVIVQGLTNDGVEPLPDVKVWLDKATNIINEVLELINQDNPERGCCEGCTCSNLKECYQHRNNVACKLKVVAQHFQDAERSIRLWKDRSNLENLKKKVEKLKEKRDGVQCSIKAGREPLLKVKRWQDKVNSIIDEVSRLTHEDNVDCKLTEVEQLLQQEAQFSRVSTISEETRYNINLENLNKDVATLKLKIESVQCLIKVGEEPLPYVKDWQDKVKKIIDEVSGLTSEHNLEQVERMLKNVTKLLQEEPQLPKVSYRPIPKQTWLQPSIQQESFETRTSILKKIIAELRKADVNMVGIYGMGGVGKTTLAKKVGDQAIQDKLFDEKELVFVEVSQSPDIRAIQGVIADHLGLSLKEESDSGRAGKLCEQLKKEKKILIILDNLWEKIKLEEIGIPFRDDCKGLKLLLTARSLDVLAKRMKSQSNFHVETLSEADAWTLFRSTAGTCVDRPHLNSVAHQVAKKCGGMPLAIVTVATALKDTEAKEEWEDALQRLDHPSSEGFEGITEEVYSSIKLSYDYLREERIKEIFLLCSRMGCTYNASVQDLFRYGLGLGFFDKFNTVEDALCNVYASVNKLKAASLLLDAPKTEAFPHRGIPAWERFAIHDVICEVAKLIALKDQHVFTVLDGHVLWSLTNKETLKNCTSITLYNIDEFFEDLKLVCPNIKFLYVKPKNSYLTIPDNFFIGMSSLQVLHLILIDLKPLPSSLGYLVNLKALCLDHCELGDVVAIGDMNKLEVLSFCGSDIQMLPKELCQLSKLRLLDLTNCSDLSVIPSKAMSSLTGIEALYMNNTSIKWEDTRPSIDELKHLRRLTTLEIHIPESKMFRGLISSEPKRYNISIGDVTYHWQARKPYSNISRRFLRLKLDTKEDWIISQLPGVEELELEGDVVGAVNLLDDLDRNGFPQLMYLRVSANNHCVCVVNSVSRAVLTSLESLMAEDMESLEKICNSPLGADSFLNLKTINVGGCNKLSNIFRCLSIVGVLPNLKDLTVSYCEKVEEVFAIEEQVDGNSTEVVHDIKFSQLSYLRLTNLPKLRSFCCKAKTASPLQLTSYTLASQIFSVKELNSHSSLFNEKVVTPNLRNLKVDEIHQIEQIWHGLLPTLSSCVQDLTNLSVYRCNNLKELFSSSMTISEELREKEMRDTIVFPKLNLLEMKHLTKLTRLCSGYTIEFPSLKVFKIQSCPQLKTSIFDETVVAPNLWKLQVHEIHQIKQIWHGLLPTLSSCVQNLTNLSVYRCDNLKELFLFSMAISEESGEKERKDTIVFPKLNLLEVEHLTKLTRLCSGYNIEFPSLNAFKIQSCPQLKASIFDETVVTPNLRNLEVREIHQIEQIWHCLLPTLSSCIQNLTHLSVYRCDNLKELFSSSMTISKESREKERRDTIVFPKLNLLEMEHLTKLKRLCSRYNVEFPSLKVFKIQSCPHLKASIFDETVVAPNLQDLEVHEIHQIEQIWHHLLPTLSSCVQHLNNLSVYRCDNLKELFLSSMTILEDEREKERRDIIVFPKLNLLEMEHLTKLIRLCSGYNIKFPSLNAFKIQSCPQFKASIFDETVATPNLWYLKVHEIHQIEQIWHNLLPTLSSCIQNLIDLSVCRCDNLKELFSSSMAISEESGEEERSDTVVFPKLNLLEMEHLTKLTRLCSGYSVEFPSLKVFKIQSCPELKASIFDEMVVAPKLWYLAVHEIHQIEQIWHSLLPTLSSCVQNLTLFSVCGCDNLKELFSSSIAISEESREKERRDTIVFPKLFWLQMENLTKLTRLCPGYNVEFPSLREFKIQSCPKLKASIFYETVATPNLWYLKVHEIHQIEQIWHNLLPTLSSCIQNLTDLSVCRCDNLKELFSSSMATSEESGEKERRDTIVFPKLFWLQMENLTKLTRLCSGYNVEFPSLREFKIQSCPELMASIFYEMVATSNLQNLEVHEIHQIEQIWLDLLPTLSSCIQNLTHLSVCRCDNLKELFSSSMTIFEESGEKERGDTVVFPKLDCLEMGHLTKLTRLCSGCNVEFPSLQKFKIQSCPQLKASIFAETVKVPYLEELRICHMDNLKMIWHNKVTEDSFSMLKSLEVTKCHKLLTLFPSNMRGRLLSLESLNVDDCHSLVHICDIQGINSEEYEHLPFMNLQELKVVGCPSLKYIFPKEGVVAKEVPAKFVFPKLTSLKLNRPLYPGKHTVEGPILKKLELCDCGIHHADEEGQMQQPLLYLVQQLVFPCLEELNLTGKQLTMMGQVQVPECLFHKLKILDVQEHESTVFPPGIIQRCPNLEKLLVTGRTFFYGDDQTETGSYTETFFYGEYQTQAGSYKEIFFCGEDQTQAAPLAKVKTLVLQHLQDMKYMWEQDSIWDLIFQNLEVLTVDTCNSLVNLMPPSASFQNLTILDVRNCNSLETVVTSSMAKSLMKLETMCISHCPNITEVIQNHGEVTEKIIFSNLKTLELIEADNLTSFCSCNFTLEFPSLEKLEVSGCRNMKTFSQGDLTMPRLKDVMIEREDFELCPDTNLNTIIKQFHAERYSTEIDQGCSSSEDMD